MKLMNYMPRPRLKRKICSRANVRIFKPAGVPKSELNILKLTLEEREALRLKQVEGFSQIESAKKMNTSQSTFQRILASAVKKLSIAIIKGYGIEITDDY